MRSLYSKFRCKLVQLGGIPNQNQAWHLSLRKVKRTRRKSLPLAERDSLLQRSKSRKRLRDKNRCYVSSSRKSNRSLIESAERSLKVAAKAASLPLGQYLCTAQWCSIQRKLAHKVAKRIPLLLSEDLSTSR